MTKMIFPEWLKSNDRKPRTPISSKVAEELFQDYLDELDDGHSLEFLQEQVDKAMKIIVFKTKMNRQFFGVYCMAAIRDKVDCEPHHKGDV